MYIASVANDYDNISSSNYTEYDFMSISKCTNKKNNIDIIIPTLLFTIPCGLSFLCLLNFRVYTLYKPLIINK